MLINILIEGDGDDQQEVDKMLACSRSDVDFADLLWNVLHR